MAFIDTNSGISQFHDYYELFDHILQYENEHSDTRACYGVQYTVDLSSPKLDNRIIVPAFRGYTPFSLSYAINEAVWYAYGTNDVNGIAKAAPFWRTMADGSGKVNSNYGHQMRITPGPQTVQQWADMIQSRLDHGETRFSIKCPLVTHASIASTHDVPCNMMITARVNVADDGQVIVFMHSFARSIDMIFGLPYDQFMLQVLGYAITRRINAAGMYNCKLAKIQFTISNCHIYLDHVAKIAQQSDLPERSRRNAMDFNNMFALLNVNDVFDAIDNGYEMDGHYKKSDLTIHQDEYVSREEFDEKYLTDDIEYVHAPLTSVYMMRSPVWWHTQTVHDVIGKLINKREFYTRLRLPSLREFEQRTTLMNDRFHVHSDRKMVLYNGNAIASVMCRFDKGCIMVLLQE